MQNDGVDGIGHDGFDAAVAGRSGTGVARSPSGRCSAPAGAQVCSLLATSARLDGRLERLPQQYSPSVPREGQADQGGWTSMRGLVWPELHIGTVIKRTEKKRVVEITRKLAHGLLEQAEKLLHSSRGGIVLNTAFIERLNGTFRERLASLTRKSRHAARRLKALEMGMYLIGCYYNFCFPHHELSKHLHVGSACTPAMAAGLTDHVWSICELLRYQIAPPLWVPPKRRGRPKKQPESVPPIGKRPRVRLRKGVLYLVTG